MPAAKRREPHITSARLHLRGHRTRHHQQRIRQPTLHDRRLHRADGHDLSGTGNLRTQRSPEGSGEIGGCTRDLVHRFYQEKYQINGGRQNRYVTGSDAVGLSMGLYDTTKLPIYSYLHADGAPHYVIADRFFQGANGGSFLNHQWLIAGRAPLVTPDAAIPADKKALNTVVDTNGMPVNNYDQYKTTATVVDGQMTVACANPSRRGELSARVWQFRREHHSARPGTPQHRSLHAVDRRRRVPQHRRSTEREGDLVGVVLGWLG